MGEMKRTSVIIPCYNPQEYLKEALESVRKQTAPVLEIILIDDGSKIPVSVPEKWNGPEIRLFRQQNKGVAAARNFGMEVTKGELIAFLDQDDYWAPEKIELQEKSLMENPSAAASFVRAVLQPGFFGFGPYPDITISKAEFIKALWNNAFLAPSMVMIRKSVISQAGKFREDLLIGDDIEFWFRLLKIGPFIQVPKALCYYRAHAEQFSADSFRKIKEGKKTRRWVIEQEGDLLLSAGIKKSEFWDSYRRDVLMSYYRREFNAARPLLWDYWKDHPGDLKMFLYFLISLFPASWVGELRGKM